MSCHWSASHNVLFNPRTGDAYFTTQGIATLTLIGVSKIKQMAKEMRHLSHDVSGLFVADVNRRPDTYWFGFDVINQILNTCTPKGITKEEQKKKIRSVLQKTGLAKFHEVREENGLLNVTRIGEDEQIEDCTDEEL